MNDFSVMPAQAGVQKVSRGRWIPALAGLTMLTALAGCDSLGDGNRLVKIEIVPADSTPLKITDADPGTGTLARYKVYECFRHAFVLRGTFSDGTTANFTSRGTWKSADPAVVQVTNTEKLPEIPTLSFGRGIVRAVDTDRTPGTVSGAVPISVEFAGLKASVEVVVGVPENLRLEAPGDPVNTTVTDTDGDNPVEIAVGADLRLRAIVDLDGRPFDVTDETSLEYIFINEQDPGDFPFTRNPASEGVAAFGQVIRVPGTQTIVSSRTRNTITGLAADGGTELWAAVRFRAPPEADACSDGSDNDGDGLIDADDPGCADGGTTEGPDLSDPLCGGSSVASPGLASQPRPVRIGDIAGLRIEHETVNTAAGVPNFYDGGDPAGPGKLVVGSVEHFRVLADLDFGDGGSPGTQDLAGQSGLVVAELCEVDSTLAPCAAINRRFVMNGAAATAFAASITENTSTGAIGIPAGTPSFFRATFSYPLPASSHSIGACSDGVDNDNDGLFDFANTDTTDRDPDCVSASDTSEHSPDTVVSSDSFEVTPIAGRLAELTIVPDGETISPFEAFQFDAVGTFCLDEPLPGNLATCTTTRAQKVTRMAAILPGGTSVAWSMAVTDCADGIDNDDDGLIDFGDAPENDPDCSSATDTTEGQSSPPASIDSSGTLAGLLVSRRDRAETVQIKARVPSGACNDLVDNDGDGLVDFADSDTTDPDPDCASATDTSEGVDTSKADADGLAACLTDPLCDLVTLTIAP